MSIDTGILKANNEKENGVTILNTVDNTIWTSVCDFVVATVLCLTQPVRRMNLLLKNGSVQHTK